MSTHDPHGNKTLCVEGKNVIYELIAEFQLVAFLAGLIETHLYKMFNMLSMDTNNHSTLLLIAHGPRGCLLKQMLLSGQFVDYRD